MIKGVIEDVNNYLGDKFSGVMYPTFIISWLITNWKIWYITFFMSESVLFEKTGCLKIEYIINQYPIERLFTWIELIILPAVMVLVIH